jgi:hypothetical protein
MPAQRKYPGELRERSVRLVVEAMAEWPELSINAGVGRIAERFEPSRVSSCRSGSAPNCPPRSAASSPSRACTSGNTDQLVYHLGLAQENGNSETKLIEAITHLAFDAGWPKAMAAMAVAKPIIRGT